MSTKLNNRAQAMIREKVDSGLYASASEVVEEAIRLLDQRDEALTILRRKLQVGPDDLERRETIAVTSALLDEIDREVDQRFDRRLDAASAVRVPRT